MTHSTKRESGQSLVEYLLLVCLIGVSSIWVVSTVGKNITEQYANISNSLTRSDGQSIERTAVDPDSYEARGLDDFMHNARKVRAGGRAGR